MAHTHTDTNVTVTSDVPNLSKCHPLLKPIPHKQETLTARSHLSFIAVRVSTKESRRYVVGDFCERLEVPENGYPANVLRIS